MSGPREGRRPFSRRVPFAAFASAVFCAAAAPAAPAALTAVGPRAADGSVITDPLTGIPGFYQDANGLKLTGCDDGRPACASVKKADFTAPDGEEFYNRAVADIEAADLPPGAKVKLVLATEAAFAGTDPDFPITFTRIRTTVLGVAPGTYTVTHPFGTQKVTVTGTLPVTKGVETDQVGCAPLAPPCDWAAALGGAFGPFVTWAPNAADPTDAPPPGYVGDALTPHTIVGSPLRQNFFRITGPGLPGGRQTDLFTVTGKLASAPVPILDVAPAGLAFGAQPVGASSAAQAVTLKNNGLANLRISSIARSGPQAADFAAPGGTCAATPVTLAPGQTCTLSSTFTPSGTGARIATLEIADNTAAGRHTVALDGTGVAAAAGAGAGGAVLNTTIARPVLRLTRLIASPRIHRARARRDGIRLVMVAPAEARIVRIVIERVVRGGRTRIWVGRRVLHPGLNRLQLRARALRRRLGLGSYRIVATPGRAGDDFGAASTRAVRVVP